jgi:pimeloyl-ACP methyl ester carboxylesterase
MTRPSFVLVHGAWGGAWIWRRVLGPLRAAGHEAHAVTLTGDGERAHLRRRDIGLADHVADVLGLVRSEELADLILVGHSYGGLPVTGAADRLLAERVEPAGHAGRTGSGAQLRGLVYVDAMVPHPGEAWSSHHASETVAQRVALAEAHDMALPPPDPAGFGLEGADRDWLLRRQTPHPFGMYHQKLDFDGARLAALPRLFIDCNAPAFPTIAAMRTRVRAEPGWQVAQIATGHAPMVSAPQALVDMLLAFAARV